MLSSSTIEILQKLDKKSLNKFVNFARSPYLNSIGILIKMAEEVAKAYPNFTSPRLSYENMWKKLYHGKPYNDKIIRNLYTSFSKLLTKFIGYEEIENDEDTLKLKTIQGMNNIKCYGISNKLIEKIKKDKDENSQISYSKFYYFSELDDRNFENVEYILHKDFGEYTKMLHSKSENFILYFLIKFLTIAGEYSVFIANYRLANENHILEEFLNSFDMESFLNYLQKSKNEYYPYVKIRYLMFKCSTANITLEEYYELKKLIEVNIKSFAPVDALSILYRIQDLILTFPAIKNASSEIFEIGKLFCSMNFFDNENTGRNYFSLYSFRNFFTAALLLKEYEWADNFVEENIKYLKPELIDNEYYYSKAVINFKFGKYEESLDYINKFETKDIIEKFTIRLYSLMNYIELGAYESAVSMIAAIRQFISESKEIPAPREESMQNSLKFFSEIVKSLTSAKKLDYAVYREAVDVPKFFQKQYIIEKMESML